MLPSKFTCHVIGLLVLGAVVVVAGGSTQSALHTTENAGIEACKRVHSDNAIGKDPIWCIGKMEKTMLVLTKSRLVFEMPLDSLNRTIDKFYLGNYAPVPLEKKWPVIANSWKYKAAKDLLYLCLPVRDSSSDYLMLAPWWDRTHVLGVTYDLKRNSITPIGWSYLGHDPKGRWISSGSINGYYELSNNNGVSVRLIIFCYRQRDSELGSPDMWPGTTCNNFRYCNLLWPRCDKNDSASYPLCKDGEDGLHVQQSGKCSEPITWDVWNGFVDSGKFYLFGKNFVFIFSEEAYNKPGTKVTVRRVPFGDFIQCGGNPQARDMDVTKKSPLAMGLIVAIILIFVLCCLCILLCLMREAMARRRRKKKGKGSKSFLPSTRRSSGLPGFAGLTRKLSGGSKRSKGPPSAGKKLSRRASSKRSLLNSKPGSLKPKGVPGTRRSSGASGAGHPLTRHSIGATRRSSNHSRGGLLTRGQSGHGISGNNATNRSSKLAQRSKGRSASRGSIGRPHTNRATQRSGR